MDMIKNHTEEFRRDLEKFNEMTEKFYKKEITVPEYKSFSGGFGSYAQRGGERSMIRLRLAGGEVRADQIKFIADSIEKYNISLVHLTTCQTIQLHNLEKDTVCELASAALDHGIITRGGGGDFPRNVMCSPLSGVEKEESFDVLPYAKLTAQYLLGFINKVKLPRKLKVCYSNTEENETHATFRDLGFVAKENGHFDVYAAGGLGIKPKFGVKVAEDIEPTKVLYVVKTMVDIFTTYGNYEKRTASRSRFLQETLGVEGLQKVFMDTLARNIEQGGLDITNKKCADYDETLVVTSAREQNTDKIKENPHVIAQKQKGLYAVHYHPVGGCIPTDFFRKIYDTIVTFRGAHTEENDYDIKLRLTPTQGLYVINLTAAEAERILELTSDGAKNQFECSTACIGADICQVGIGKSQALLKSCVERVREENFADGVLPSIHISGCPSSCSAHQTAAIGLRGGMKQTPDGPKPAFALYENGCERQGEERMGDELGVLTVDELPEFFVRLGKRITSKNMTYQEFVQKYPEELRKIVSEV